MTRVDRRKDEPTNGRGARVITTWSNGTCETTTGKRKQTRPFSSSQTAATESARGRTDGQGGKRADGRGAEIVLAQEPAGETCHRHC